jgi:hypothetical protein
MDLIEKLSNFEDMKYSGFIRYNGDGSGTYFIHNDDMDTLYYINFNRHGIVTGTNYSMIIKLSDYIVDFIINVNNIFKYDNRLKYIDGWVREKVDKHYGAI